MEGFCIFRSGLRPMAIAGHWERKMKAAALVLAVVAFCSFLSAPVMAQGARGLDAERFKPASDSHGMFVTEGAEGERSGDINLELLLNYSRNPLVLMRDGAVLYSLVSDRLAANVVFSMGMTDWFTLAVDVPALFYQDGMMLDQTTGEDLGLVSASIGDIRVIPKLVALRQEKHAVNLSLLVPVSLPSGDEEAFMGSSSVTLSPMVAISRRLMKDRIRLSLNVGAWLQAESGSYQNIEAGNELFYRLGASWRFVPRWECLAEVFGGGRLATLFENKPAEVPLEWLAGIRFYAPWDLRFSLAGGGGIQQGWGTPNWRFVFAVAWSPRVHDTDSDGLPDDEDRCPKEAGPAENGGCPWGDSDADGVADNIDRCPQRAGDPDNEGCPWGDRDKDGLKDNVDKCPAEAGPAENNGCPWGDKDKDGVKDNVDKCPEQPEDRDGFGDEDGCPDPDNDKDGIPDGEDACPNRAGVAQKKGCPLNDKDSDGLVDEKDRCPEQAGPPENGGCPWGDKDEDGLKDNVDKCPEQPEDRDGFEDEDGCPDTDNDKDGIVDEKDKCPLEPETINGVKDEDGCPDKGRKVVILKKKKIEILQKVYFATGRSRIMPRSYKLLDQVAQVLRGHQEIKKVRIEGHTDSRGSEKFNQRLSEARARAVMNYLIKRGGIDPSRLEAVGYGESRPIADNSTRKGREKNRRVEFTIVEME
ncbi:MAG: hypothetical protein D6806_08510 [Deltaproteobacteria bacterium]|nr:MAG: hypothetical protein D6806_08510 [Deltaproteobacteria bacterium]